MLRNSLWSTAVSSRRFNPELRAYYELKHSQRKHSSVAVARKLVHLIYSLWKDNRPYDPSYQ
jgi:hypothetical protein